jgi:hypothetical protein
MLNHHIKNSCCFSVEEEVVDTSIFCVCRRLLFSLHLFFSLRRRFTMRGDTVKIVGVSRSLRRERIRKSVIKRG